MLDSKTKNKTKTKTKAKTKRLLSRRESIKKAKKKFEGKDIPEFLTSTSASPFAEISQMQMDEDDLSLSNISENRDNINRDNINRDNINRDNISLGSIQEEIKIASNDNVKFSNITIEEINKINDNVNKGKIVISMSKISLFGVIFGLFLISVLSFISGFVVSMNLQRSSFIAFTMKDEPGSGGGYSLPVISSKKSLLPLDVNKSVKDTLNDYVDKIIPPLKKYVEDDTIEDKTPIDRVDLIKKQTSIVPNDNHAGRFTVELTSGANGVDLSRFAEKLRSRGYGAYLVKEVSVDKKSSYYSLRIGSFVDYGDAYEVARKIRYKYKDKYKDVSVRLIKSGETRIK